MSGADSDPVMQSVAFASAIKVLEDQRAQLGDALAKAYRRIAELEAQLANHDAAAGSDVNAHASIRHDDSMDETEDDGPSPLRMAIDNTTHPIAPPSENATHLRMNRWASILNLAIGSSTYHENDLWTLAGLQSVISVCEAVMELFGATVAGLNAAILNKDASILEMQATIQQLGADLESKEMIIRALNDRIAISRGNTDEDSQA